MHRKRNGVAIAFALIAITAILALVALVIDTAYAYSTKTKVKNAVDLASLAGVSQLTDTTLGSISNAKNSALSLLNDNLSMTLENYTSASLASSNLLIQVGVYDFGTMTFTPTESSASINAVKVVYTHTEPTIFGRVFSVSNLTISDNAVAAKQIAGRLKEGGGFPLAINKNVLAVAAANSNMFTLNQVAMSSNSYFTAYKFVTAKAVDIISILDYFEDPATGTKPPLIKVGDSIQINNGEIAAAFMSVNEVNFEGMTYVFSVITLDTHFASMVTVEAFVGATIDNIYIDAMNRYNIDATLIPGYIDNTWGGLGIGSGPGNISAGDKPLLATYFGIVL